MNTPQYVTKMQQDFLNELAASERPLSDVLEDSNISAETFASWLISRPFHLMMHRTLKAMGKLRELNVQSGAAKASETLHRLADTDAQRSNPEKRKTCVELIRLAREQEQRMKANKKMMEPTIPLPTLPQRDFSDEQSRQLFKEMVEDHYRKMESRR